MSEYIVKFLYPYPINSNCVCEVRVYTVCHGKEFRCLNIKSRGGVGMGALIGNFLFFF